tara:strand:- start:24 stop:1091 length:1068 start_codon:yes stop_codon:yes gene_type:complete
MANNKLAGYTPDSSKQKREGGSTEINNRLDRFNPYEFRKGMDYELTSIGCARLAESTIEEREKSTETVLKNLEEHQAYYSALIQYTIGMNQAGQINKMTFKKYLEENFPNTAGTGMIEVTKEFKNDKMTDVKPKDINTIKMKTVQPLKEAIKREIAKLLLEGKEEEDDFDGPDDDALEKDIKKQMGRKKRKDRGDELDDELNAIKKAKDDFEEKHEKAKEKAFPTYQKNKDTAVYKKALSLKDKDINNLKSLANKYTGRDGGYNVPANVTYKEAITLLGKRVTANKREQEQFLKDTLKEKRNVSKMEMTREDHMRLLEIIKEYGVDLREGSENIRMHYEIAKASYLEGIAKGMKI